MVLLFPLSVITSSLWSQLNLISYMNKIVHNALSQKPSVFSEKREYLNLKPRILDLHLSLTLTWGSLKWNHLTTLN